jgi:hypothetical protein
VATGPTSPTGPTGPTDPTGPTAPTDPTVATVPTAQVASQTQPAPDGAAGAGGLATTSLSDDGKTLVIHNLNPAQLTNLVVNAADNRSITQNVNIDIILPGFDQVQQNNLFASMGMKLNDDAGVGIVGALGR